jgi:hypothetical protein
LLAPTTAGEGAVGVVADIAKLLVGREAYHTRELAENHEEYLAGHGESPGWWQGHCVVRGKGHDLGGHGG